MRIQQFRKNATDQIVNTYSELFYATPWLVCDCRLISADPHGAAEKQSAINQHKCRKVATAQQGEEYDWLKFSFVIMPKIA